MSKASMIGDVVKVVADAFTSTPKPKPKGKGGRKRKPRGPKAATPQQKAAARALGININTAKALSPADLDKAIKSRPNKAKAPVSKRTPKEERTLAALIKRQKKDDSDFGGEEPDRLKLSAGGSEVLPSKAQLDPEIRNYSKKRLRHLIKTGQAKMVVDKNGKRSLKTTGKFSPPASEVARDMGRKADPDKKVSGVKRGEEQYEGSGDSFNPMEALFDERKKGGQILYKRSGGALRGWGAAKRGY
tara:strand:- start:33 stop:767 length:735 start_codon:yes stop_codon:yes gene_type:complete